MSTTATSHQTWVSTTAVIRDADDIHVRTPGTSWPGFLTLALSPELDVYITNDAARALATRILEELCR